MSRIKIIDIFKRHHPESTSSSAMFGGPFTQTYMAAYGLNVLAFDRYFTERYFTFEIEDYFDRGVYYVLSTAFNEFLLINNAKLTELFRLENIDDTKYSLYNNYDMVETAHSSASSDLGSRTDTQNVSPYDTESFSPTGQNEMGAQHNATAGESTLTRVGNIGVMTVSDMLGKHEELFSAYLPFYQKMFDMFAKEYLYVGEVE